MLVSFAPASRQESSRSSVERRLPYILCGATILLYLPVLGFGFVYDDTSQIVLNPLIQSWKNLPLLFHTDIWRFQNPLIVGSFWRPVFAVWLLINYSIFGLRTAGWHAAAVLLHVVSVFLVYRLTVRLSGDVWLAGLAGLLFAIHPTHLETVAWVSGATDSLLSVFLLGSLLCLLRGWKSEHGRKWIWIASSLLLYELALLTKETAVVEPVLVLVLILLFAPVGKRRWSAALLATLPFVALSILYLLQRHSVLHGFGRSHLNMTFTEALIAVPSVLWFYVKHLLWPIDLSVIYDASPVMQLRRSNFWFPLCALSVLTGAVVGYLVRSRDRVAAFAMVLLISPILPVLYIPVLEPGNFLHDRYLYLPSIGFALLVGIAVRHINIGKKQRAGVPVLQTAVAAILLVACAVATAEQQTFWANDILLFSRATAVAPGNETAFNNLGTALASRGYLKEARFAFQQVVRRDPLSWRAQYNIGLSYFMEGAYAEAETALEKAVNANPLEGDPAAALAEARIRQSKFAAAEPPIRHAIAVMPYKPGYRRLLALSLEGQGRLTEALLAAKSELVVRSPDPQTEELLGRLNRKLSGPDSFSRNK